MDEKPNSGLVAMPPPDVFEDTYGKCTTSPCTCLKPGPWRGRACLHWVPIGATNWDELKAHAYGAPR